MNQVQENTAIPCVPDAFEQDVLWGTYEDRGVIASRTNILRLSIALTIVAMLALLAACGRETSSEPIPNPTSLQGDVSAAQPTEQAHQESQFETTPASATKAPVAVEVMPTLTSTATPIPEPTITPEPAATPVPKPSAEPTRSPTMPPTFESQGEYFATVYNEAEDTVFLKVNDYEVNYREYAVIKARFETNLANQKVMDANKVPDDEWSPPEGSEHNDPVRPLPEFMFNDDLKKMGEVMDKHGSDAGAIGVLILEYGAYSRAVDDGYGLSDAEVTAKVAEMKAFYEDNIGVSQAGELGEIKGYISVVGEDVYWRTIYPYGLRMRQVTGAWRWENETAGGQYAHIAEHNRIALKSDLETLSKVRVEVIDQDLLKATPEQGIAYITEYMPFLYSPIE